MLWRCAGNGIGLLASRVGRQAAGLWLWRDGVGGGRRDARGVGQPGRRGGVGLRVVRPGRRLSIWSGLDVTGASESRETVGEWWVGRTGGVVSVLVGIGGGVEPGVERRLWWVSVHGWDEVGELVRL